MRFLKAMLVMALDDKILWQAPYKLQPDSLHLSAPPSCWKLKRLLEVRAWKPAYRLLVTVKLRIMVCRYNLSKSAAFHSVNCKWQLSLMQIDMIDFALARNVRGWIVMLRGQCPLLHESWIMKFGCIVLRAASYPLKASLMEAEGSYLNIGRNWLHRM
jgi:hypothetical protein